jgi:hypothetical protein
MLLIVESSDILIINDKKFELNDEKNSIIKIEKTIKMHKMILALYHKGLLLGCLSIVSHHRHERPKPK